MFCVVTANLRGMNILRHIIYDIGESESLDDVKEKYYRDYNKTSTDEFHICQTREGVDKILEMLKFKT